MVQSLDSLQPVKLRDHWKSKMSDEALVCDIRLWSDQVLYFKSEDRPILAKMLSAQLPKSIQWRLGMDDNNHF